MTPITMPEATAYIRERATHEDLDVLRTVLNQRRTLLRTVEAALIRPGAEVSIRKMRPGYLTGLTGTVSTLGRSSKAGVIATVSLDGPSAAKAKRASRGKYEGSVPGIPISCLAPL